MMPLAVTTLLWIGMLVGVSFLATPVKFLAPSLSLPVALDVGRQTFFWFSRVEIVLAFAALAGAVAARTQRRTRTGGPARGEAVAVLLTVLLLGSVAAQVLWLLPVLDARVEVILGGGTPPASSLHTLYVGIELAKLAALIGVAWLALSGMRRHV
ncbi:MAG: hypothetical protein JXB36_02850 [Gammaproteobacteria bacterium]|nr:hypothetical protein [Gammaproteobacteria bacterium]